MHLNKLNLQVLNYFEILSSILLIFQSYQWKGLWELPFHRFSQIKLAILQLAFYFSEFH